MDIINNLVLPNRVWNSFFVLKLVAYWNMPVSCKWNCFQSSPWIQNGRITLIFIISQLQICTIVSWRDSRINANVAWKCKWRKCFLFGSYWVQQDTTSWLSLFLNEKDCIVLMKCLIPSLVCRFKGNTLKMHWLISWHESRQPSGKWIWN